uniref:Uncharacterized protein n=1 Tax=Mus musculus TaxID=10090 RepID=Q3UXJ4_MOUSE|nr:unnamed protein product [Mus musculus]
MAHRNGRRTCAVCKGTGRKPASAGKTNWWVRCPDLDNELGQLVCLVAGESRRKEDHSQVHRPDGSGLF